MKAILMLEDGTRFLGKASAAEERVGKIIFNTAVVGYQELLTNPANSGKIIIFTYPLIGNYGVAAKFNESDRIWAKAAVIKEKSRIFSNWQAEAGFEEFAEKNNLMVLTDVDTRTLALHIRQKGEMSGIISTKCFESRDLLAKIDGFYKKPGVSSLPEISSDRKIILNRQRQAQKKIAVLNLGVTNSMLKQLKALGALIVLLPYNTSLNEIMKLNPQGLIISSGPEEDAGLSEVVDNIKGIIGKIPVLGIAAGMHVLAQAVGMRVVKMKVGHHGSNYPVYSPRLRKSAITAQNHSFMVDADSLNGNNAIKITAYNLNDHTVEEIESSKLKFIGAQYEPLSPGFNETHMIFHRFMKLVERRK